MSISTDIQSLSPTAIVEVFELDTTILTDEAGTLGIKVYMHSGTNGLGGNVIWQGIEYNAFPIEVEGFERSGKGTLPRPKIRMANITGLVGALAHDYADLVGAKVVRRRTFAKYLDSANYPPAYNLLLQSNGFHTSTWAKVGSIVTPNIALNPVLNGFIDAAKLEESNSTNFHQVVQDVNLEVNTEYTYSMYFKAGTRRYAYLKVQTKDADQNHYATFDLNTGKYTVFDGCTPSVLSMGSGWYRCSMTFNSTDAIGNPCKLMAGVNTITGAPLSYQGSTGFFIYAWGGQIEKSPYFTDYQPVGATFLANPYADPNVHFADEIWYIDRKSAETGVLIEFELSAAFDISGVKLPRRQCIQNTCTWEYRSAECTWVPGALFTKNDLPTTDPTKDACGKRLTSCEVRFNPPGQSNQLPYGAFPGVGLIR